MVKPALCLISPANPSSARSRSPVGDEDLPVVPADHRDGRRNFPLDIRIFIIGKKEINGAFSPPEGQEFGEVVHVDEPGGLVALAAAEFKLISVAGNDDSPSGLKTQPLLESE